MNKRVIWCIPSAMILFFAFSTGYAQDRLRVTPETEERQIIYRHPKDIDPTLLPIDKTEALNRTGVPQDIDVGTWRLTVTGSRVGGALELRYPELQKMEQVRKKVLLICPGFFKDYAQWEGVPLQEILEEAGVPAGYHSVIIKGKDGYSKSFDREEIETHLIFLALKVNGQVLPKAHGFPLRVVAEDIYGGRWVKWITEIEVR